jgi:hypothetical protein
LRLRGCSLGHILARSAGCFASLKPLVLSAPHLVARLSELLLRFTEFALKALQLALTNFTLDSFDPVNLSVLRMSHCRHYGSTDRYRCAAAMPGCAIYRSCSVSSF